MELKTLKEIDTQNLINPPNWDEVILTAELKEEAKKHFDKFDNCSHHQFDDCHCFGIANWIKMFFNLEDEDA